MTFPTRHVLYTLLLLQLFRVQAFAPRLLQSLLTRQRLSSLPTTPLAVDRTNVLARDNVEEEDVTVNWIDDEEEEDDDDGDSDEQAAPQEKKKTSSRWNKLNARIKERIIQEGQARAIANKKKREPAQDKKRRMYTPTDRLSHEGILGSQLTIID